MPLCEAYYLGCVDYGEALAQQEELVAQRKRDEIPDRLLLLEHPHVITLGRAAKHDNVLVDSEERGDWGVDLYETGRGGDVTYHGPGQLVGYPIISLAPDRCDVRRYVRDLEQVLIRTAADFGIEAETVPGLTGVWTGTQKLAAIGVRISRWVTMHGFALNISTDLEYFDLIVPCGISDRGVTSFKQLLGRTVETEEVARQVVVHFGEVFGRRMVPGENPLSISAAR